MWTQTGQTSSLSFYPPTILSLFLSFLVIYCSFVFSFIFTSISFIKFCLSPSILLFQLVITCLTCQLCAVCCFLSPVSFTVFSIVYPLLILLRLSVLPLLPSCLLASLSPSAPPTYHLSPFSMSLLFLLTLYLFLLHHYHLSLGIHYTEGI